MAKASASVKSGAGTKLPEVLDFASKHGLSSTATEELQSLTNATVTLAQKRVTVSVPGSVANLGPGLETCGMAVDIWDEFTLEYAEDFSLEVFGDKEVPRAKDKNPCVAGAASAFEAAGRRFPQLRIVCSHRIPWSKGLGAPAASFVGGYLAGSVLCSEELSTMPFQTSEARGTDSLATLLGEARSPAVSLARQDGLASSSQSESATGGVDTMLQAAISRGWNLGNVCPAIYGALQVGVQTPVGFRSHRVPVPHGLVCVIFVPNGESEGQKLPEQPVERKAAIFNVGRMALLINCFCTNNFDMFSKAVEDTLVQPHCSSQFPFLGPIVQAAVEAGAAGATPCGYGPSVMALIAGRVGDVLAQSNTNELERAVAKAMLSKAEEVGTAGQILIARPADGGARVVAQKSDLGTNEDNGNILYFQ